VRCLIRESRRRKRRQEAKKGWHDDGDDDDDDDNNNNNNNETVNSNKRQEFRIKNPLRRRASVKSAKLYSTAASGREVTVYLKVLRIFELTKC
jgi:hypothetical protein